MFREFDDLMVRGDREELFKQCINRCYAAVSVSYEQEKKKMESLWRFDERYHEHGIEILYERVCYAMAMIADRFREECIEIYGLEDSQKKASGFATMLSIAVDEVFSRSIRRMELKNATIVYYIENYLEKEYEEFWSAHKWLISDITAVRDSIPRDKWVFLCGFSTKDIEYMNSKEINSKNRDCVHIMRIYKRSRDLDVRKFLSETKRGYLPMVIGLFSKPREAGFADMASLKWSSGGHDVTQAVCFKCGEIKWGAFSHCEKCGAIARSDDELILSLAFTDHYFDRETLERIGRNIRAGRTPQLPEPIRDRLRLAIQATKPAIGLGGSTNDQITRPDRRDLFYSPGLAGPFVAAVVALIIIWTALAKPLRLVPPREDAQLGFGIFFGLLSGVILFALMRAFDRGRHR